jgi:hypothetical protein
MCLPNPGSGCSTLAANPVLGSDPACAPVPIRSSVDPNAKSGPFGPGAQQFRKSGTAYNYNVEFENQATATLPAQQVVVTDSLDTSNLDLSTFSLGPISFGRYTLTPPGGAQHFSGGIDLRPDLNLIVKVDAGLNLSTGLVTWQFTSLDPDTEQPTTDPAAGFLPPDVTPPQGVGTLLNSIQPKSGIASGTLVCNQATVVFDANPRLTPSNGATRWTTQARRAVSQSSRRAKRPRVFRCNGRVPMRVPASTTTPSTYPTREGLPWRGSAIPR